MNKISADFVIFDFDGVLVDSTSLKTSLFGKVVSAWPVEIQKSFIDYHKFNGGLSRWQKFDYFLREIVKLNNEEEIKLKAGQLADQFGQLLSHELSALKFSSGSIELLQSLKEKAIPAYIVSGGAEVEVKEIVERNRATSFFKKILGSPVKKMDNLEGLIAEENLNGKGVFIGDAYTDFHCARHFHMPFVFMKKYTEWKNWENDQHHFLKTINDLTELKIEKDTL